MRRLAPASLVLTAMILATPSAAVFEALTTLGPIQTLSAAGGRAESPTIAVTP